MAKLIATSVFFLLLNLLVAQPTTESALDKGRFFKLAVEGPGIYRIDHNWLQSNGIDPNTIVPAELRLFGHGGTMLPEENSSPRFDDLHENAITVVGGEDGSFDSGDHILFYAPGHDSRYFDATSGYFRGSKNIYEDKAYYFLQVDGEDGLRIAERSSLDNADKTSDHFLDFQRFEEDKVNLLGKDAVHQGSGKQWFGDELSNTRTAFYPDRFRFPNVRSDLPAYVEAVFAGRSKVLSNYEIEISGSTFSQRVGSVSLSYEGTYARNGLLTREFFPQAEELPVRVNYPQVSSASQGWLDYIQVNAWRSAIYEDSPIVLADPNSLAHATYGFSFDPKYDTYQIWDVTDPTRPVRQLAHESVENYFAFETGELRQFVLFHPDRDVRMPDFVGAVANQNLHGIQDLDMLIIYHKDFETEARRLATHREEFGKLSVVMADVEQIFNEFASGSADPTAIRDFARLLYDRSPTFRFLLLFGDASYDYRHRVKETSSQNFVPTFQSANSLDPIYAYPSDDYFALLSPNEGPTLRGALDISVGRLPVRSSSEAQAMVDKIIRYESDPAQMGDWRMQLSFVADDEDGSQHMDQCDRVARDIATDHPEYNQQKIYFDAFDQVALAGGDRYPEATAEINRTVFKGALSMVYLGHGGPTGWAQERVLKNEDINSWSNTTHYPVLVTATCSFTGFDDPAQTTAGEYALLNPAGGMVALFSTVRLVFSTDNFRLTKAVHDRMFVKPFGQRPYLGDIMKEAKNANPADTLYANSRKFFLFGDPATPLSIPKQYVYTTHINDIPITEPLDTLNAMESVVIQGFIGDEQGNRLSDFNGTLFATIFDKAIQLRTLGNDPGSFVRPFDLQTNALFKGKVSVENGEFTLRFVMPKDINYQFGQGKISYYAADTGTLTDAGGYFSDIIIGGTNPDGLADDIPPLVEVYMNDTLFREGGITGPNPVLLARIFDDNGINITGNNIGHDLLGILDGNTQQAFVLNDFFISEQDDFRKGSLRFPLNNLAEGRHEIEVRAWDIANNLGIGRTSFVVVDAAGGLIRNLSAFPNPFFDRTTFSFEHNLEKGTLGLSVEIFDLQGIRVKELRATAMTDHYRNEDLVWDACGQNGAEVSPGMYLYRVTIEYTGTNGEQKIIHSDTEKLLFIR